MAVRKAKKLSRVVFSSDKQDWGTPVEFYRWLDAAFGGFTLDVCANRDNHKCERYFTSDDDGLAQSWAGSVWFCNPEYDKGERWIVKGRTEALWNAPGAFLVPSRVDTRWWREATESKHFGALRGSYFEPKTRVWWMRWAKLRVGVYHHDQRLVFEGGPKDGAPFPSSVIMYLPNGQRITPKLHSKHAQLDGRAALTLGAPA